MTDRNPSIHGVGRDRIVWQDTARGIGITLVVLGHVVRGLLASHLLTAHGWSIFDFSLYSFHMPLFMLLAGLNVPQSLAAGKSRYVRSKILGILYPYFLWSLIQGSIMAALSGLTNSSKGFGALAFILWNPISPFWFLYALFFFYMAARFLPVRVLFAVSVVTFLLGEHFSPNSFPHQLLHFPLFFVSGILLSSRPGFGRIHPGVAVAGLLMAIGSVVGAWSAGLFNYNSVLMLPAAVGGILFTVWLAQRLEGIGSIAWVGRISLAIYVMHIVAAAGTRILMQKLLHIPPAAWIYVSLGTIAGMALPIGTYLLSEQLGLLPWLGLKIGPAGKRWMNSGTWRLRA